MMDLIKSLFKALGLSIHSISNNKKWKESQSNWIRDFKPATILDIGANTGQYAKEARSLFPDAMIYSFEPLQKCYDELIHNMEGDKRFKAFPFALGDVEEEIEMFQNDFSPSSSILEMADLHKTTMPVTKNASKTKIQVKTLDGMADKLNIQFPLFVKIDVQGYENKVIKGGRNIIGKAGFIVTELTFVELYKGQALFDDVYSLLRELGFVFRGLTTEPLVVPENGMPLQSDGYFSK